MSLRALLVDDEELARRRLARLLAELPDVEVVGECEDGRSAIEAIERLAPDVVLLDIRMPEVDGFDVLAAVAEERLPQVVFVTAYEEHAVRAFEVRAVDYLLKPVAAERLAQALERVRQRRARGLDPRALAAQVAELGAELLPNRGLLHQVWVRVDEGLSLLRLEEVEWIDGAGNYVRLHAGGATHRLRHTLSGLEQRLDPKRFVRVHRSTIVNLDRIAEMRPAASGDSLLILRGGQRLTLSRTHRALLDQALGRADEEP